MGRRLAWSVIGSLGRRRNRQAAIAQSPAPNIWIGENGRKSTKAKTLSFVFFYFSESGLFKGLCPIQMIFFHPPLGPSPLRHRLDSMRLVDFEL
jgi:hypothetical protein